RERDLGRRQRLGLRAHPAARPTGDRPLDRRGDRDARARGPRCVPRQRSRSSTGRQTARPADRPTGPDRVQRTLAALALLRHPAFEDHPRASRNPLAAKGGRMIHSRPTDSPIGLLTLAGRGSVLTNLRMVDQTYEPSRADWSPDAGAFSAAADQLQAYFAGELTDFDVELDLRGTEFQRRVWQALLTIPYGETRSYGEIAEQIG